MDFGLGELVYLFGSHAKDSAKEESDFDIAVLFDNPSTPLALREIAELIKELSKTISFKIDTETFQVSPNETFQVRLSA
ncbi:MAG: hypothetical protein DRP68_04020 [Candidatus Omnitrophota bacterium]|nr:MAG: hypothetical protein DRP68_04020 [Candidatus Omnitrophota bacterium]